ncbi:MAG: hypothetical protein WCG05_04685 [Alphaproteobacteria bacterium]
MVFKNYMVMAVLILGAQTCLGAAAADVESKVLSKRKILRLVRLKVDLEYREQWQENWDLETIKKTERIRLSPEAVQSERRNSLREIRNAKKISIIAQAKRIELERIRSVLQWKLGHLKQRLAYKNISQSREAYLENRQENLQDLLEKISAMPKRVSQTSLQ